MKLGLIGLGKMGGNMTRRLLQYDMEVVVWDPTQSAIDAVVEAGAESAASPEDILAKLPERKVIWLMVPAGKAVEMNLEALLPHMNAGDVIIDGGNSFWRESVERANRIAEHGVHYIDCGVSGGVWGLSEGYALMYGGNAEAAAYCEPIFKALAPEGGYKYCGESGAGHLVKMVHNGIEYGMMQAYAEGFEIMEKSPFNLDLAGIAEMWMHGSVVRSWLLELTGNALREDPKLDQLKPFVSDSGEGRWTVNTAIDFDVPVHVISAALFARFQSRDDDSYAMKMLSAMRNQFGGHAMKKVSDE
ncbi:phosphogluconate dehydrogenase (NAD(+)-dependent, decarboxylating) [Pontibacter sp. G13]|uniref:phosphogluconate dehydrogenase (NAD(+)-dependent, decarboxylating) n=1 Tax=Pontibacter sp. G13 TaxID=3074898 RepID=UPI00288BF0BF|nr:decarboxylating 6-phosphogluconate dehydrogenase [Pontibacter sp. G13]WNJ18234.1 decarboxylating 6-phosphogluconate dehydrogenase [Pontibacter sp. G13]